MAPAWRQPGAISLCGLSGLQWQDGGVRLEPRRHPGRHAGQPRLRALPDSGSARASRGRMRRLRQD
eukprot:2787122-Prymnesium_polylepis.1